MGLQNAPWQRPDQPALSSMTTQQAWCRVTLYNPTVLKVGGTYKMWYLGNRSRTRISDMDLGYATSDDGLHWTEHPDNPILIGDGLPETYCWQTPHVIFDPDENRYRMWFIMSTSQRDDRGVQISYAQQLGYAESPDGLSWKVHPEPLYPSGRRPCVLKDSPTAYRMWMNSAPEPDGEFGSLAGNIYRFTSSDGLTWTRDPEPVVIAEGAFRSVVYPFVLKHDTGYIMWYGCHVADGIFELYCSTSIDGLNWTHHRDQSTFPSTRDRNRFDGRYTSTPCVLDDGDRYLLYFSTRDWNNIYGAGDGLVRFDNAGIYGHIGVAQCPKTEISL